MEPLVSKLLKTALILATAACVACGQPDAPPAGHPAASAAASPVDPQADLSYALGYRTGEGFRAANPDLPAAPFARGIEDVFLSRPLALGPVQMDLLRRAHEMRKGDLEVKRREEQGRIRDAQEQARRAEGERNLRAGREFLAANASRPGIVTLPGGLQYHELVRGTGATPGPGDQVRTHYRGTYLNGEEFDSSYSRGKPSVFKVSEVIPGWTQALQRMQVGAKWELFIPPDLAYGEAGTEGGMPPNAALRFEIELLEVIGKQ